jgi:gamma-glutamyltranspeptidase/glutathione hydrolase
MRDASQLVFNSRRSVVFGTRGMVASSQPLASQVGLSILMQGGNAADAAVAMAATLNLTEPCSTGIGGDCFSLFYDAKSGEISALNASGRAPKALTLDLVEQEGLAQNGRIPPRHAYAVTVPGTCSGWFAMIDRHGTMPMTDLLAPAIRHAEAGFPVGPITARLWEHGAGNELRSSPGGRELLIDGRAPRKGELFRNPTLARTLRTVAEGGPDAFYKGEIAVRIAETVQRAGGVMTTDDLASHRPTWETPISTEYRGVRVWECPPNGQGLAALLALNVFADLPRTDPLTVQRLHHQVESMRLAFADTNWYVADPAFAPAPLDALLSAPYADQRRGLIDPERAMADAQRGAPVTGSDTVYFCVVDGNGNGCSFIQSNYNGFGTGLVPEGCGFSLQNRGANFVFAPGHPNSLAPGKRPYHTIIPAMLTRSDGSLLGPFGVMGGFMQPQGHMQVVINLMDDGLDPQQALDQPRYCIAGDTVCVEDGLPAQELAARGHEVRVLSGGDRMSLFGRGQIILRQADGVLWAGSDPRADGCAIGF